MNTLAAAAISIVGLGAVSAVAFNAGTCGSCTKGAQTAQALTSVAFASNNETLADPHTDGERLKVGDVMPDFELPTPVSPDGSENITLSQALENGPLVVTFFRGSWCPYCRGELSELQDNIEKFNEYGATILAISPEKPEGATKIESEDEIAFYIAQDENNAFADQLGLMFELDAATIKRYNGYGINLRKANGTRKWTLPVPATYVIDTDRTVRYVYDDENIAKRAKPRDLIKTLEKISSDG